MKLLLAFVLLKLFASVAGTNDRCLGELGCFPVTPDFQRRLMNPPVATREEINVKLRFYSENHYSSEQGNEIVAHRLNEELSELPFDGQKATKIVVHGWIDNFFLGPWMLEFRELLQRLGDFNVILVDWSGGNGLPYYQASVNARVVGAEIGLLISKLQATYGLDPSSVHIYGHSLGAHVAGYAGKWLNGTLGRITALDPAEPLFQGMPYSVRLDRRDASFVEAIHTNGQSSMGKIGLGMNKPVGHVDYFPNGGSQMPGCDLGKTFADFTKRHIFDFSRRLIACNHVRSIDFALAFLRNEADNSQCVPVGYACENYEFFKKGFCSSCGHDGSLCGIPNLNGAPELRERIIKENSNSSLKLFFETTGQEPFCLFHYNVELRMKRRLPVSVIAGTVSLRIRSGNTIKDIPLEHDGENVFVDGSVYRFLITSETQLDLEKSLSLFYRSPKILFAPELNVDYVKIKPMTIKETTRKPPTFTFCPSARIWSRKATLFDKRSCSKLES